MGQGGWTSRKHQVGQPFVLLQYAYLYILPGSTCKAWLLAHLRYLQDQIKHTFGAI